jgi:hypothetical protein
LAVPGSAAAVSTPLELGTDNAADATTRLKGPAGGVVFGIATATMPAFELGAETVAIGTDAFGGPALSVVSVNQDDSLGIGVSVPGNVADNGSAVGISVDAGSDGVRAEQHYESGAGVVGISNGSQAAGVEGLAHGYYGVGASGWSGGAGGIGVVGSGSGTAAGGLFQSEHGPALQVSGPAQFTRSGRALVPANHSYVDITVPGGLTTGTSMVIATIQAYRSGVAVSGVRLNYPSAGKARIYLTKVASTTATTPVGWIVLDAFVPQPTG